MAHRVRSETVGTLRSRKRRVGQAGRRRHNARVAAVVVAVALGSAMFGLRAIHAHATIGINDFPGGSYKGYASNQCTSFAAWRLNNDFGLSFPSGYSGVFGNADTWATGARSAGIPVDSTPSLDSVVEFDPGVDGAGSVGHVAFVIGVNSNGTFNVEQYNFNLPLRYSQTTFTVNPGVNFIHFGALRPAPAVDSSGNQYVFWEGTNEHLYETWYTGVWNGPLDLTVANGWSSWLLTSPPSVAITSTEQDVFWSGANGDLFEAWYTGGVWHGPADQTATHGWSAASHMSSAPSVFYTGGQATGFWEGTNSHLWEAWYTGGVWYGATDQTTQNGWGSASNLDSPPGALLTSGGQQTVFWHDAISHLWEAWYTGGVWYGPLDLTSSNRWSATSDRTSPPSVFLTSTGQQTVFWEGAGGSNTEHLYEVWYTGVWNGPADLTAANHWSSSSNLISSPGVVFIPSTGQQNVFWEATNAHIWQAWYTGVWNGPADLGWYQ